MLMQWEKSLELGVDQMDKEHRDLVAHANTLFQAIKEKKSDSVLLDHLKFLAKYTLEHFQHEEAFQKKIGYPDFNAHKAIHEEFKKTVLELTKKAESHGLDVKMRIDINTLTINWLKNHIGVEDRKVANFYKQKNT